MQNVKTAIKGHVSSRFLEDFATQSLFLSGLIDPTAGNFDQDTLKNGLKILINTLSCVRRFDPAFAQDQQFVELDAAIGILKEKLPNASYKVLRRASNLARTISKRVKNDAKL